MTNRLTRLAIRFACRALMVVFLAGWAPLSAQGWCNFYSAYQDGLDAQREGDDPKALAAFQAACHFRPLPAERVLTYGMNYLEPYHPYLHVAETALALGQFETAEGALSTSRRLGLEPRGQWEALARRLLANRPGQNLVLVKSDPGQKGLASGAGGAGPEAAADHFRF